MAALRPRAHAQSTLLARRKHSIPTQKYLKGLEQGFLPESTVFPKISMGRIQQVFELG